MNLVPAAIGTTVARKALLVQRSSPNLLFGAGIVGMVGSTVLACRATLKMETLLEETEVKLETAKTYQHPEYDERDRQKDIKLIRVQTGIKVVRLYAPAVILGGVSVAALTRSHNILSRRNAALTAAYGAIEKGFAEYRARVVEKYGEDEDRNFRYGTEQIEVVDEATGKKEMVTRVGPDGASVYARFFDPFSPSWSKQPEYNLIFLKTQQNYFNNLLTARGHVFLNEVYDALGLSRSQAGSIVGWVLSRNGETDNFIDFGIWDATSGAARNFVNGHEGSILLDFNVDGIIFDKIDELGEELSWQLGH